MIDERTKYVSVLHRQFDPSFRMVAELINNCPEDIWNFIPNGKPFWQQIMHILIGIQFWFRESEEKFSPPDFGNGPVPDIDTDAIFSLTKKQVNEYQEQMEQRIATFFNKMNDERLLAESYVYQKSTYADVILGQIRHFQHHVGYCNCILHQNNAKIAKWS
jgi:hypothetical protein